MFINVYLDEMKYIDSLPLTADIFEGTPTILAVSSSCGLKIVGLECCEPSMWSRRNE